MILYNSPKKFEGSEARMRITKRDYILLVLLILLPVVLFGGMVAGVNGLAGLSILCSNYIAAVLVAISIKWKTERAKIGRTIIAGCIYALIAAMPVLFLIFF